MKRLLLASVFLVPFAASAQNPPPPQVNWYFADNSQLCESISGQCYPMQQYWAGSFDATITTQPGDVTVGDFTCRQVPETGVFDCYQFSNQAALTDPSLTEPIADPSMQADIDEMHEMEDEGMMDDTPPPEEGMAAGMPVPAWSFSAEGKVCHQSGNCYNTVQRGIENYQPQPQDIDIWGTKCRLIAEGLPENDYMECYTQQPQ